ncbi:unnamed protein product [Paramecium sonneborni]|uniref:Transmembrane protein n=1 Tax=Paramecium sonneborni TaxID=65129 RepID=A0A8S1REK6_9CILI|nr:unnamed protein product [Paramecium sonneborni]
MQEWPKKLFLAIAFISCFTCYARPDYNLPLFAFAYLLWDIDRPVSQKIRLIYLFVYSWIIDFVWLVYWGPFWNSSTFSHNWADGIQTFVLVLSVINFILKLGTIVICILAEKECKDALHPENAMAHAKNIFSSDGQHQ